MCELYVKADPILYESRSRSLRIRGVVTTLRLENQFWDILSEIAEVDGMTTNQLIAKLYEEVMDFRGEVVNFASFLRVSCTRYLAQKAGRPVPLRLVGVSGWLGLAVGAIPSKRIPEVVDRITNQFVADRLPVRFQMQLHKQLWGEEQGR